MFKILILPYELIEPLKRALIAEPVALLLLSAFPRVPLQEFDLSLNGGVSTCNLLEKSLSLLFSVRKVSSPLTFSVSSLICTS